MDPTRIEGHERLEVRDRHDHGAGIEFEQAGPEDAGDRVQVVAHRAVRRRGDDDEFVPDAQLELPRHLVSHNRFVSAGGRQAALYQGIQKTGQRHLALGVDAEQNAGRCRFAGTHEPARVHARGGGHDRGIGLDGAQDLPHVGTLAAADGLVQAALGPVVGIVDLDLSTDERRGVLDQFRRDPVSPADHEHHGKVADPEAERGENCSLSVTAEVAPPDSP